MRSRLLFGLAGLLALACVGEKKTQAHDERLKQYVLSTAPASIGTRLNINYDGKVTLLGYKLEPKRPKPGQTVTLTMLWRADQDLASGWSLFTHLLDDDGRRLLNIDNVGPLRQLRGSQQALPPGEWQPGKYYVDEQRFVLPQSKNGNIHIVAGVWRGTQRLKILAGPHDRDDRGIVAKVGLEEAPPTKGPVTTRVPNLTVPRLPEGAAIVIDGKLNEEAWNRAGRTGRLVDVATGKRNVDFPVNGNVRLLWDDAAMYVGFDVEDTDVVGGFDPKEQDPQLWTRDTVELMIDPEGDGDNKDYYEIQINPQNLVFDSRFDSYNQPRGSKNGPFGHQSWSAKLTSAVSIDGVIDDAKQQDRGYVVEARIPWTAFDKAQVPPKQGAEWRMNFYAMQANSGVAWSPILGQGNFHKASRFGRVTWGAARKPPREGPPAPAEQLRIVPHQGAVDRMGRRQAPNGASPGGPAHSGVGVQR